jgi:rhamnulokinase
MNNFYVACDLGAEIGRVMLGTLHDGNLVLSEVRRFQNSTLKEKDSVLWNIPPIYQEILTGLREISTYEETIQSISCYSEAADYLLFEEDGSLNTPIYHGSDPRGAAEMKSVLDKIPWETIYNETGVQKLPSNTLFQLAAEKSRRLKKAAHLLPIADGFNFLLSGVARAEMSLASTTQLYNPVSRDWSEKLITALKLPAKVFPQIVPAGTKLGALRPEVVKETRLEGTEIVASCSYELAAALAALPVSPGENSIFLRSGPNVLMGTELLAPIISDESRETHFTHTTAFGGSVHFQKPVVGLRILEDCKRYWKEHDRELDDEILKHLATSCPPFESLINPDDPRFQTPEDMPLKIQAFCKETNQNVPRKPGPITRCVLESLALLYRKTLQEIESLTGRRFARLYLFGGSATHMLYHFTANALEIPVVLAPPNAAIIGNVLVQALAQGHLESIDEAREIVRNSFKMETITPHPTVWTEAYDRMVERAPA